MINTKSFAKQRIWSRSETSANNRSRTSVCINLFSSVYSVILMGFLMIINHSVCFLVWYVTYQYISHLGCLNFFSLFKIFNMQFSKNNQRNLFSAVEIKGFEPLTPCLQGRCSPNWAIPPFQDIDKIAFIKVICISLNCFIQFSGVKWTRTIDLTLIRRAL